MFRQPKTRTLLNNEKVTHLHSKYDNMAALEIIGDTVNAIYKDNDGKVFKVNHNLN
jgi:hypothetical protein